LGGRVSISKLQTVFGAAILIVATAAVTTVVISRWNPFPPEDYEDCATRAAKDARSKDALSVLLSICTSEFKGRRKPGGGYTYHDNCRDRAVDIKGPNPTPTELEDIQHQCFMYIEAQQRVEAEQERRAAELAEQKRRAQQRAQEERNRQLQAAQEERNRQLQAAQEERNRQLQAAQVAQEERNRQLQAAQEAKAAAERQRQLRKISAMSGVKVRLAGFDCPVYSFDVRTQTCVQSVDMKVEVTNGSKEALSSVSIGLAFVSDNACPSSYAEKHTLDLTLSPGETRPTKIEFIDVSLSKLRVCTAVVDVRLAGD
jgi:hypothetical protein